MKISQAMWKVESNELYDDSESPSPEEQKVAKLWETTTTVEDGRYSGRRSLQHGYPF